VVIVLSFGFLTLTVLISALSGGLLLAAALERTSKRKEHGAKRKVDRNFRHQVPPGFSPVVGPLFLWVILFPTQR
jgi:hypothetical protein